MLLKTKAIILHSIKYGETSLIVHAYTGQWGRKSFIIKGIRNNGKKGKSFLYGPLKLLDLDVYYKPDRELNIIREANSVDNGYFINDNMVKNSQRMFIAEVLMKILREEEKNQDLFLFLVKSFQYFSSLYEPSPSFHLLFLFRLSRFIGFLPRNNYSDETPYFDIVTGSFAENPASLDLQKEIMVAQAWKDCFENDYDSIDQAITNQRQRNAFLESLLAFYHCHVDHFGEMKSLEIVRALFID